MFLLSWLISSGSLMLKMLQSSISSLNMNTKFCDDLDSSSNEVQYTVVQRPCFFIGPGDLISNLRGHPRPKRGWKHFCSHVISVFSFLLDLRSRIIKTTRLSQFSLRSTFSTQNLFQQKHF